MPTYVQAIKQNQFYVINFNIQVNLPIISSNLKI